MYINIKKKLAAVILLLIAAGILTFALAGIPIGIETKADEEEQLRVPILLYHSINETPVGVPELSVRTEDFEKQMQYLADNGYTPIYLDELDSCSQYSKPVVITFDDGYVDNYTDAYPVLKKHHFKATIFIITKLLKAPGYLSADEIGQMTDLISFQSHTQDHVWLDRLNLKQIAYQCSVSKLTLAGVTGRPVYALSYPNGRFSAGVERVASEYYLCAVTTLPGTNAPGGSKFHLRRTYIQRSDTMDIFISKLN